MTDWLILRWSKKSKEKKERLQESQIKTAKHRKAVLHKELFHGSLLLWLNEWYIVNPKTTIGQMANICPTLW